MILEDRYINPLTDFGFKKLFGEEVNKDLLIDFLNTLLPEKHTIKDLKYQQNELQTRTRNLRGKPQTFQRFKKCIGYS
jgi:hypothetical protein